MAAYDCRFATGDADFLGLGHAPDGALLRRGMAQKVSNLAANRLITLWINRDC